ncbi:hypothetical protein TIFTF001_035073 [Ficus carica]|uniref:Uncharacterized protein n=1 Tax=Ficus carica TaxID=3494 RepID=A0AA88E1K1_FICCA|nr:hypothetical protein TIFTF001_035073 [Ficus carica]
MTAMMFQEALLDRGWSNALWWRERKAKELPLAGVQRVLWRALTRMCDEDDEFSRCFGIDSAGGKWHLEKRHTLSHILARVAITSILSLVKNEIDISFWWRCYSYHASFKSLRSHQRTIITLYLWMEGWHASRGSLRAVAGGISIFFCPEDKSILWLVEVSSRPRKYTMAKRNLGFNLWDLVLLREVCIYLGSKYEFGILGYQRYAGDLLPIIFVF